MTMEAYVLVFACILIGASNAQIFENIHCNETGTPTSYQFNAKTGEMCAANNCNSPFEAEFCFLDPNKVVIQLASVREVEWRKKKRVVIDRCQSHELKHCIDGIVNTGLTFTDLGFVEFPVVDSDEGTLLVPTLNFTWDLEGEGQAKGAEIQFSFYFFQQSATILYEGQKVKVVNGTLKTAYEIKNWTFCDTPWDPYDSSGNETQCLKRRADYIDKPTKLNETVLEIQFDITTHGDEDDGSVRCFPGANGFAPRCTFGKPYSLSYFQTTTVDGQMSCLPNEYPRIIDCKDPDESVIYSARYQKKNKKDKKDENKDKDKKNKDKKDKDKDKKDKDKKDKDNKDKQNKKEKRVKPPKLVCNKSAIIFAVPRFKVKAFYDPFNCLFCRGSTIELVFPLLIMACVHSIYFGI